MFCIVSFNLSDQKFNFHVIFWNYGVKLKFVCPMHGETEQTKTLEFGAEKGLLQGQARRVGELCSKSPNSLMGFREEFFKTN